MLGGLAQLCSCGDCGLSALGDRELPPAHQPKRGTGIFYTHKKLQYELRIYISLDASYFSSTENIAFRYCRAVDPDPYGSAFILPPPGGKNGKTTTAQKNARKLVPVKSLIFHFEIVIFSNLFFQLKTTLLKVIFY